MKNTNDNFEVDNKSSSDSTSSTTTDASTTLVTSPTACGDESNPISSTLEPLPSSNSPQSCDTENTDIAKSDSVSDMTTETSNSIQEEPMIVDQTVKESPVSFKVIYNKKKYDVSLALSCTVAELKAHLESIISVPVSMQKVMIKGLAKDQQMLKDAGVISGSKIMVVGSTISDIMAISTAQAKGSFDDAKVSTPKEPLCKQKLHQKIIDRGIPEDAMPGILGCKDSLPPAPLSGMLNKSGGKLRLTFKLEADQLWIGTKERTEKVPMGSIKNVVSEPIAGHEQYHVMGLQLGTTEASRYWIYWVPAQYVEAIKESIIGKWQL